MFKFLFKIYKMRTLHRLHGYHFRMAESWLSLQRTQTDIVDKRICYEKVKSHYAEMQKIDNILRFM